MKAVAQNELPITDRFAEEMNYCVGCLACTSACPAGVDYAPLLEAARATAEAAPAAKRAWTRRVQRWFFLKKLFTHQSWLHLAARLLRVYQESGCERFVRSVGLTRLLPKNWQRLERQTPVVSKKFSDEWIRPVESPENPRYRVLLLSGCVQDVLFAEVNRATADVLLANGCEVRTPREQGCCGSLHAHNGDLETAERLARRWLDQTPLDKIDAIISNAAGCGSHLKHFSRLLAREPAYAARAHAWDGKVRDISEWLIEIGLRAPRSSLTCGEKSAKTIATKITYHDACHLCHGQGIKAQPREVLGALPGVEIVECAESTWCCGSAGVYSLMHPETANRLRERKWEKIKATGATVVAMGNPGCALHLQPREGENREGIPEIIHPVVLLARAYADEKKAPR
jgi:glycolate oxidase iron-sulfur subunit